MTLNNRTEQVIDEGMFLFCYREGVQKNTAESIDEKDQGGVRGNKNHLAIGTELQMCPLKVSFTFVFQHFEGSLRDAPWNHFHLSMNRDALSRDCEDRTVQ